MHVQRRRFQPPAAAIAAPALALATLLTGCTAPIRPAGVSSPSPGQAAVAGWRQAGISGRIPPARDGHWMAGDPGSGRVILFGGKGAGSRYFNDTWTYTPATGTWTELTPTGSPPPARFGHVLVHDPADHRVLLFGGVTTAGLADDLWALDLTGNAWTPLKPAGARPAARLYPSMAFDDASGNGVVFGGWTGTSEFADTWVYDTGGNRWHQVRGAGGPRARWGSAMAYDAATGTMILFGGLFGSYDGSTRLDDTWEYNPKTDTWKSLSPAGRPPARGYAAMVYDAATDRVVLFGGFAGGDGLLGDTWEYDRTANTWNRLVPGPADPPRRDFSAAVYDRRADTTVLFGGLTGNAGNVDGTLLGDTWRRP